MCRTSACRWPRPMIRAAIGSTDFRPASTPCSVRSPASTTAACMRRTAPTSKPFFASCVRVEARPPRARRPPRQVSLSGGYLPGVPDADSAQMIALAIGEERAGADILIGPLRALSVSGTSLGPGGTPMRNIMIAVVNTATGTRIGSGGVIMPGPDGRFVLSALPPGHYTLMGRAAENDAGETDDMPYFAETEFVLTRSEHLRHRAAVRARRHRHRPDCPAGGCRRRRRRERSTRRDARRFVRVAGADARGRDDAAETARSSSTASDRASGA